MKKNIGILLLIAIICAFTVFTVAQLLPQVTDAGTSGQLAKSMVDEYGSAGHGDPFAQVFEIFAIILLCAVIGRFCARQLKKQIWLYGS